MKARTSKIFLLFSAVAISGEVLAMRAARNSFAMALERRAPTLSFQRRFLSDRVVSSRVPAIYKVDNLAFCRVSTSPIKVYRPLVNDVRWTSKLAVNYHLSTSQLVRPLSTARYSFRDSLDTTSPDTRGGNNKQRRRGKRSSEDEQLYRADRVLANRMENLSRSDCTKLLKERRVFQKARATFQHSEEIEISRDRLEVIRGPSQKISMNADLWIRDNKRHSKSPETDDAELSSSPYQQVPPVPPLLMVFHKPKWVLSVMSDPHKQRPCLNDEMTQLPPKMHPVGRLDYDTSGLLLLSSDGSLTQRLLHPKHHVEKLYEAVVTGVVDETTLSAQLQAGVKTGEGVHTAKLVSCRQWGSEENKGNHAVGEYLEEIRSGLPKEYNQTDLKLKGYLDIFDAKDLSTVSLIVSEGKYRMVRRILANCGHPVVSLKRLRLGEITLECEDGNELPEGSIRELTEKEVAWAKSILPPEYNSKTSYKGMRKAKKRANRP